MIKFEKAFTLAEVLVTLGIIGVVAAMTVPNLIKNYQEQTLVTELHKVYNEFSQAFEGYLSDQRVESLLETDLYGDTNGLSAFIRDNFKIINNCGAVYTSEAGPVCFSKDDYYTISQGNGGGSVSFVGTACSGVAFTLPSGAAICAESNGGQNSAEVPVYMVVDVNGANGPNVLGRDVFAMYVRPSGEFYDKDYIDNSEATTFTTTAGARTGAFGKVMADGWQMTY